MHGQHRRTISEYGLQLQEKQKAKAIYGITERPLHRYYRNAIKSKENSGEVLLQELETRLDSIIYYLGMAKSRRQARQLITHGKILVDNKKVDIPSFPVKSKQTIKLKNPKAEINKVEMPSWLSINNKTKEGTVIKIPSREEISQEVDEKLIIEYYSR